jgi:HSP20 family protein
VWQIAIDILDTKEEVIILAPIAGIYLDNIDVSLDEGVLSIIGERKKPEIYWHASLKNSECFWWEFSRTIILPENLDFESIHASMENNLLVITIQKLQFTSQNIKIDRIES